MPHCKPCCADSSLCEPGRTRRPLQAALDRATSKLRAIPRADIERIVAGISLTAGGVLGVMVAGWLS